MPEMNFHQSEAIANADAHATNAGLPSYSDLLRFADRMAHLDAGCLLTREDFANIARNIVAPEGRRLPLDVVYGGNDEHGRKCARRFHSAAECTCGKAERDALEIAAWWNATGANTTGGQQ